MAEEKQGIFREKALERISSPENLTEYLKVTNPGIWIVLISIVVLLLGILIWSMTGRLETLSEGKAVVNDGTAHIVVTGSQSNEITSDMSVRIESEVYDISIIETDEYGRSTAYAPVPLPDGVYDVDIITESIHPISFLLKN
ncbi:MAG: hypothetical protein K6F99_10275 [Lachnospiraceae bacterium]|nr:hypothetical protein [Lachnospiraceae bacterium]